MRVKRCHRADRAVYASSRALWSIGTRSRRKNQQSQIDRGRIQRIDRVFERPETRVSPEWSEAVKLVVA